MSNHVADAELVGAHLAGQRAAIAAIYDRYSDALYDTARGMLRDGAEAADVVQDTFLVAMQRMHQLRDPDRLRPWLFSILRHHVYRRSHLRQRAQVTDFQAPPVSVQTAMPTTDDMSAIDSITSAELAEQVRAAAAGLDERDQMVLELAIRQELSGQDLADALGVTVAQSYVLVSRMRDRIARSLGALTVARLGRRDCAELNGMLASWDGRFSVQVRKRVARHVDACSVCERTRQRCAVLPSYRAAGASAAPADLRHRVLALDPASAAPPITLSASSGFPVDPSTGPAPRKRGTGLRVAAGLVVVAVLGALTWSIVDSVTGTNHEPTVPTSTAAAPSTAVSSSSSSSPTTSSTTAAAGVRPTAPPAVPVPLGRLVVSKTELELGARAGSMTVTLTNGGRAPLTWSAKTEGSSLFGVAPANGTLAPRTSTEVTISIDRSVAAEGSYDAAVAITAGEAGSGEINVTGRVEHPPVVAFSVPGLVLCTDLPLPVRAAVSDESAISTVTLSWDGPGGAGSASMVARGDPWLAVFDPQRADGEWTLTVTAVDLRGNQSSASQRTTLARC